MTLASKSSSGLTADTYVATRTMRFRERYKLNLVAESFNLFNRDNQRVAITSNGLVASAAEKSTALACDRKLTLVWA